MGASLATFTLIKRGSIVNSKIAIEMFVKETHLFKFKYGNIKFSNYRL